MAPRKLFGSLCVLLALAGSSAAADSYSLERKLAKGSKLKVEERRTGVAQLIWQTRNAKVGGAEETITFHRYIEEVRTKQPLVLWREYDESTRSKHKPKETPRPIKTSLHKQRVLVYGQQLHPDGQFKIAKADAEAMRFDRLPDALLPSRRLVKVRESWTIPSGRLVKALLPPSVAATSRRSTAKVTLKSVKKVKGVQIATLKVKIAVIVELTSTFPGIDMALKGDMKWNLDDGACVEANLSGAVKVVMNSQEEGNPGTVTSEGSVTWAFKAEILEARGAHDQGARTAGDPPPPGTVGLQCELDPKHVIQLKWHVRCTLCGKPLDKDRACPGGDPFVYQYCPHDGAPLHPVQ
jgi:hypothetical protein